MLMKELFLNQGENCKKTLVTEFSHFVAFVEDIATMSSIRYFENHVAYILCKTEGNRPIKQISLR